MAGPVVEERLCSLRPLGYIHIVLFGLRNALVTFSTPDEHGCWRSRSLTTRLDYTCVSFMKARVTYLGHIVGQGRVCPVHVKEKAIDDYAMPTT